MKRARNRTLPTELWEEIGKRLDNQLDVLRFRLTCKSWRSYLPPRSIFPLRIPSPPNFSYDENKFRFYITENTVYSYKTSSGQSSVIVGFESRDDKVHGGLSFSPFPLYTTVEKLKEFPKVIDMQQCRRFTPLFTTYFIRLAMQSSDKKWIIWPSIIIDKIVLISYDNCSKRPRMLNPNYVPIKDDVDIIVVALTTLGDVNFLSVRSMEWKPIKCDSTKSKFDDIINYNYKLWGLGKDGEAYVMDFESLTMTQVVKPPNEHILDRGRKRLIEASLELYMLVPSGDLKSPNDIPKEIKVFKLKAREWIRVDSIGKHIFFMTSDFSFSTVADTKLCFGNHNRTSRENCVFLDGLSFCRDVGSRISTIVNDYPLFPLMSKANSAKRSFGVYSFEKFSKFEILLDKDVPEIFWYKDLQVIEGGSSSIRALDFTASR